VKRFLRFVILLAALAAIAVLASRLRQRGAASPEAGLPGTEAVRSSAAAEPAPPTEPDDLAQVWGIGPVYCARLAEAGITTFAGLAAADPAAVVAATGVPAARAADWIAQAGSLVGR
jgi:predicted flap endonuclease-1-like 5' DNA nuclease